MGHGSGTPLGPAGTQGQVVPLVQTAPAASFSDGWPTRPPAHHGDGDDPGGHHDALGTGDARVTIGSGPGHDSGARGPAQWYTREHVVGQPKVGSLNLKGSRVSPASPDPKPQAHVPTAAHHPGQRNHRFESEFGCGTAMMMAVGFCRCGLDRTTCCCMPLSLRIGRSGSCCCSWFGCGSSGLALWATWKGVPHFRDRWKDLELGECTLQFQGASCVQCTSGGRWALLAVHSLLAVW